MKAAPSCFILATAVASIFEVVAWNDKSSNSNRRFGVNRIKNNMNRRQIVSPTAQSFTNSVEQQQQPSFSSSATTEILGMPVESPTNTSSVFSIESTSATLEYYPPRRIVADGARAAVVAVVSAAAIGGARHAIEMIACKDQEKMMNEFLSLLWGWRWIVLLLKVFDQKHSIMYTSVMCDELDAALLLLSSSGYF